MLQCSVCGETDLPDAARFCGCCGRLLGDTIQHERPTLVGMETSGAPPPEDEIGAQTMMWSLPPGWVDQLQRSPGASR
jgi:hypothetical protein